MLDILFTMKIYFNQLRQHLSTNLLPVYLVSSDEPLQQIEALDLIRKKAFDTGFLERKILTVLPGFDWKMFQQESDNYSLFSEKIIIDLNIPNGKIGKEGSDVIKTYCNKPNSDVLVVIRVPKLQASALQQAWVKSIDKIGAVLRIYMLTHKETDQWLSQNIKKFGLNLDNKCKSILLNSIEGNLIAAKQELFKLKIGFGDQKISEEDLFNTLANDSRYEVFDLTQAILIGDFERISKITHRLMQEGVPELLVLYAITSEVRNLLKLLQGSSDNTEKHLARIWPQERKAAYRQALERLSVKRCEELLHDCIQTDRVIKGFHQGNMGDELLKLGLCAGANKEFNFYSSNTL